MDGPNRGGGLIVLTPKRTAGTGFGGPDRGGGLIPGGSTDGPNRGGGLIVD